MKPIIALDYEEVLNLRRQVKSLLVKLEQAMVNASLTEPPPVPYTRSGQDSPK